MPRALIVGCGFVGEAAADLFHAAGWQVIGWTGSADSAVRLGAQKPYPVAAHDVTDPAAVRDAAAHSLAPDALVMCVSSGRGGGPEQYRRVYLGGAQNLLAAFRRRGSFSPAARASTRKRTAPGSTRRPPPTPTARRDASCAKPRTSC